MKKKLIYCLSVAALILSILSPHLAHAGGPDAVHLRITPSPSTTVANNSSSITLTVYGYDYRCSGHPGISTSDPSYCAANNYGDPVEEPDCYNFAEDISVSGSGNTLSATQVTLTPSSSCQGSVTLKSSVAGVKNIHVQNSAWPSQEFTDGTVSFTAPPAAPASTPATNVKPKSTVSSSPTVASPPPASAPATPMLSTATASGTSLSSSNPQLEQDQPLVLSGKTVPNGIVTLTIHSTPRTVTTSADKDGNWSYTVTGLETGNHTVQASVKDPATGLSSPTTQLLAFSIKAKPAALVTPSNVVKKTSKTPLIAGLGLVVLILGGGFWYYWTKLRKPKPAVI